MTIIRCSVCKLPAEKQQAIDAALRGGVSLHEVATRAGINKSSLQRHSKHIAPVPVVVPALAEPEAARGAEEFPVMAPFVQPPGPLAVAGGAEPLQAIEAPAAEVEVLRPGANAPAKPMGATKAVLLGRIETLWGEAVDGLKAAKEPVVLTKADGSTVEVPGGDLRARAGFIREARQVLELQGAATGDLVKGDPAMIGPVMIVVPANLPTRGEFEAMAVVAGRQWR